jgi:hypothetical protein
MEAKIYDFCGWATRSNIKCSDGRVILKDAFKHNDGMKVPLVWNHQHNTPFDVIGHAILESRDGDIYAYCSLNGTESGQTAKGLIEHKDIFSLSIYANQLKQQGPNVLHGNIREVSLVLAGANPGAFIDIVRHSDEPGGEEEAIIFTGEEASFAHSVDNAEAAKPEPKAEEKPADSGETVQDVFDTLTEKQKTVVYAMIAAAAEGGQEPENDEEEAPVKHNAFDKATEPEKEDTLSHSDMMAAITDAKRYGSMKESVLQHGITNIDYLFPEAQNVTQTPTFIQRDMGWVTKVMGAVHHVPFSRIKSMHADITADDARARGYVKGNLKVEEVFGLLKRATTPTTVYKKQGMDRDDIIDITDFDVVAWLKAEMRLMLDEELARSFLVGDGRSPASDDKINELNIRPIWTDSDLYTIKALLTPPAPEPGMTQDDAMARAIVRLAVTARSDYRGSGNPTFFTNEAELTRLLLREDKTGRLMYDTVDKLATSMRVSQIVTSPILENLTRMDGNGMNRKLIGLIVNLNDYYVGADKGGAVNMFDDFDIDYNKEKYLIETRCSGALVKPYSALALEMPA